jgi:tRNA A-37 threonylcarbamoyl transferase component Bud32
MRSDTSNKISDRTRAEELFHEALSKPPEERQAYLEAACQGDIDLRREVESLLESFEKDGSLLEIPAIEAAARVLAKSPTSSIQEQGLALCPSLGLAHPDVRRTSNLQRIRQKTIRLAPWWMYIVAAVFLADCLIRMYCNVLGPGVFDFWLSWTEGDQAIVAVVPTGSMSDRVGIKPGDIIRVLDGHSIRRADWKGIVSNLEIGRSYRLDVDRMGQRLQVTYRIERVSILIDEFAIWQIDGLLLFATAFLIGFSRPHDFLARMGALALATLWVSLGYWSSLPPGYAAIWRDLPKGVGDLLWIPNVCSYLVGPIVLTFFALFPRTLFHARWPWVIIWLPALCFVPAFFRSTFLMVYRPLQMYGNLLPVRIHNTGTQLFGLYGLVSLAFLTANYFRLTDRNDRRRLRVLFIGGGAAVLPGAFRLLIWKFTPVSGLFSWLASGTPGVIVAVVFAFFPACFAYSILRHRLFDIRIIIRQGVQYAVTRGALLSVVPFLGVVLVADLLVHGNQPLLEILKMRGWVYAILSAVAVVAHSQRRRWGEAIDRRFFREQYDARCLLREVAGEAARARSFGRAAHGVVARIEAVLHPEFAAILRRSSGDTVFRTIASSPSDKSPLSLAAESDLISILRILGGPLEVLLGESGWLQRRLPDQEVAFLQEERIDLIVPIAPTSGQSEALLVLGVKRSEEPYTREDQDLLATIASSLEWLLEIPEILTARPPEEFEVCPHCGLCYDSGSGRCAQEGAVLTPVHISRTLAGRYRLERRRGRGGMGAVYEATDEALARKVALKVIREDRLGSYGSADRFQREARVAAGFTHPNVVTVYDYGIEAGRRAFLVMELLEGTTLRDEIRSHKRLDAYHTIRIFHELCSAVEAAHRRQLIHRDLKPENIFLARNGEMKGETVKVLDFGIAKFLPGSKEAAETPTLGETDAGILVGTPGYMSPEQLLGERPAVSWDLWALAVTAYETLTGGLPFAAGTGEGWRRLVLAGDFSPLSEHVSDAPARWQEFFSRCLAKDPKQRPRSAAAFLRQLERALA